MNLIKFKNWEAKFERELAEIEIKEAGATTDLTTSLESVHPPKSEEPAYQRRQDDKYQRYLRDAEESPRTALIGAWIDVEYSLGAALGRLGLNPTPYTIRDYVSNLHDQGHIDEATVNKYEFFMKIVNEVEHVLSRDFEPSPKIMQRFLQTAIGLSRTFDKIEPRVDQS